MRLRPYLIEMMYIKRSTLGFPSHDTGYRCYASIFLLGSLGACHGQTQRCLYQPQMWLATLYQIFLFISAVKFQLDLEYTFSTGIFSILHVIHKLIELSGSGRCPVARIASAAITASPFRSPPTTT